jgi:predicted dehydrogenase
MSQSLTTRRDFLRFGTAAAVGLSVPVLELPAQQQQPLPRQPANDRIRIGCIGVGNQGRGNLGAHLRNTVAVCEVDRTRLEAARDRVQQANGGTCAAYNDYRRLLDDRNVDAVVITTPDHWHALITIQACQAGKHVYCEKPLTLTVAEGRAMVRAARHNNVVVQTGSQQRSDDRFRQACELVRNGKLGRLQTVRVGLPAVNFAGPPVADSDPPAELDYEFWLGPAPRRPYNVKRVHYNFRFFWDYSGGQMTNFGAHDLDITQWALGMDESGPVLVEGTPHYHPQNWYEVPQSAELTYTYSNGVRVICGQGNNTPGGARFEGTDGWIHVNRRAITGEPAELLRYEFTNRDVRLPVSRNHHQNWLEAIRSNRRPICDVEIGHRSATVCHLGNIAMRTGRRLRWDPAAEAVLGDEEQQRMLQRPYREPWRMPVIG